MKKIFLFIIVVYAVFNIPQPVFASSSGLVIDEFRTDGLGGARDEYVVVTNYSDLGIDSSQYALTIKTGNTTYQYLYRFVVGSFIKPKEKIRICHNETIDKTLCNFFYTGTSYEMKESGVLAIIKVISTTNKPNIDVVGYGNIDYGASGCWITGCEEYPLDSPSNNMLYRRVDGQDTDNSTADFESYLPPAYKDPNVDKIVVSELMPAPSEGKEWFELFNPTNLSVSLSGLKICDAIGSVHCYYFPETEILEPYKYKTYSQDITKITLNNTGDWLELRDGGDNLLADSGGSYGNADSGISLSLFGSDFMWSKTPTPNIQNIFTDIVEEEEVASNSAKSTSKKVKAKLAAKTTMLISGEAPVEEESLTSPKIVQTAVKGAKTTSENGNTTLGYLLITLAVLLLVGYNLWERRAIARKLYDKISRRDR